MSDKFKRVQPGQRVGIPAGAWNAMLEAAKAHEQSKFNSTSETDPFSRQADICKVLNESGGDLGRFAVAEIVGPLIAPEDNEAEFQTRVAFRVTVPSDQARGKFVVLLEPIPAGRIGRAWVSGVCPVKVNVQDEIHPFCDASAGSTAALASGCFGSARILWRQSGLGLKWAVVRIGNGDDGGRHFRFGLLGSLSGGEALAELKTMEGDAYGDAVVRDPEGIFSRLDEGDRGIAVKECGKYWVIQARCPAGNRGAV